MGARASPIGSGSKAKDVAHKKTIECPAKTGRLVYDAYPLLFSRMHVMETLGYQATAGSGFSQPD